MIPEIVPRQRKTPPASPRSVRKQFSPKWSIGLLSLCYIGAFKGSPILVGAPIDLTLIAAAVVVFAVIAYVLRGGRLTRATYFALALWAAFVPGLLLSWPEDQWIQKSAMLFSLTLLIAISTPLILQTEQARKYWIFGIAGFAVLMLVSAFAMPNVVSAESGRLSLEGGTTIVVAQLIGAGCVATLTAALRPGQKARWSLMTLAAVLAFGVILIGSRGPFLAMLLALTLALTFGRIYAQSRVVIIGTWVALLAGTMWFVFSTNIRSAARLVGFFTGEQDHIREKLYSVAWESIVSHPQGVGWGGFTNLIEPFFGSSRATVTIYPHNLFLEVAAEGGWIAALAVLIFVSASLTILWRRSLQAEGAVFFGLAIYWVMCAQTSSDINGNRMMWASLIVAFAIEKVREHPAVTTHLVSERG